MNKLIIWVPIAGTFYGFGYIAAGGNITNLFTSDKLVIPNAVLTGTLTGLTGGYLCGKLLTVLLAVFI